ncbi:hypothetical protein ACXC9Q_30440 [Kribbella sp. CWNU-51]
MTTDWSPGHLVPATLLTEIKAADAAARAARAVPGVVRLQPGIWGLLRHFATHAWEQATGKALPDLAGVTADIADHGQQIRIDLRIVVSIHHHAAHVGAAVHDTVTAAVATVTDKPARIRIHIVEIDLEPDNSRTPTS